MVVSKNGLELIKKWEGRYLKAYKDIVGVWTIGYGMIEEDYPITGVHVHEGVTITNKQCDELFEKLIINKYCPKVDKYMDNYNFNQNQYDALVSFAYNIGNIDGLTQNGNRSISFISEKILAYCKAGGKEVQGLLNRRKDEKKLFDTPVEKKPETKPKKTLYTGKLRDPKKVWIKGYMKKGDRGNSVKEVQNFLNWYLPAFIKKYEPLKVDGKYGSITKTRVTQFQSLMKIQSDGKWGHETWLKAVSASK